MSTTKLDSDNKSGLDPHSSLKDALLLLINGHPPRHVQQQAEERVKSYVQEVNEEEEDAYTETLVKLEELNVIVGCKKSPPTVDPVDTKNFFEEHFADMPSDPKYWGLDACDLASSRWRSEQTFSRGYGRGARYCTEIGRLYPIVTCPDTWRQYRYTNCIQMTASTCLVPQSSICRFDDYDVYDEGARNRDRAVLCKPAQTRPWTYGSEKRTNQSQTKKQ
ncbi:hypothetical protein TSMEX_001038 [Taenia solium]|eukprot:TsM_000457400 transcript=TsM_000457400 gene=TsM_000457400